MSQSSSATTLLKAPDLSLKGGLQSVLQSLDVQLEDELVRYRRERRRQAQADKLKAQQAQAAQAEAAKVAAAHPVQQSHGLDNSNSLSIGALQEAALQPTISTADDGLDAAMTVEVAPLRTDAEAVDADQFETDGLDIAANSSSLALVRQEQSDSSSEVEASEEEDYFASSAALLESLGTMPEEDLEGIKLKSEETSFLKQLMTPAGVGASLLVLAAGAASGYLMMNPNSVSHLRFSELFPSSDAPEAAEAIATNPTTVKNISGELPPGAPDLTQREFIQLSLSNLGSLDPNGNPIHSKSGLGNLAGLGNGLGQNGLALATAQPLPGSVNSIAPGITQSAGGGGTAPGGSASLPNVIQPIPESGLLSSLSNAVSGRSVAEQLNAATPLPAVVSPVAPAPAPAPAAIAAAPVIQPVEVTQLPTPAASVETAPVETSAVEEYIEEYIPPAPEAEVSYWEPEIETVTPEAIPEAVPETIVESYEAVEPEVYSRASYIVVAPYISDAALADIQAVVPDAYVENYDTGAYIQAGVFDDAASAGDLLMRLQEQGISASVENR